MKRFCLFISLLCLCGCSSLKMETDPQIVFIDSNVTAWVYDGNVRLGETPFFGKSNVLGGRSLRCKKQAIKP